MFFMMIQLIMMLLAFGLLGLSLDFFLNRSALPLYFALPLAILTWYLSILILMVVINKFARWRLGDVEGEMTPTQIRWWVLSNTSYDIALNLTKLLFFHSPIPNFFYKLFGMKMGKNLANFGYIYDPDAIEVGDNVLIGTYAILSGHYINKGKIYRGKVKVGNNSIIGASTIIAPGVKIEDNTEIFAHSLVLPFRKVTTGRWAGIPIRPVKKNDEK